jgi:hypothetical protein
VSEVRVYTRINDMKELWFRLRAVKSVTELAYPKSYVFFFSYRKNSKKIRIFSSCLHIFYNELTICMQSTTFIVSVFF